MYKKLLILLGGMVLALLGCQPHTTLHPSTFSAIPSCLVSNKPTVSIHIQDERHIPQPRLIAVIDKNSYFGYESLPFDAARAYQLEEPVAQWLQTSVSNAFKADCYILDSSSPTYVINVQILGTGIYNTRQPNFSTVVAHVFIRTKLSVMDMQHQSVVRESLATFDGTAVKKIDQSNTEMLDKALEDATGKLVKNLFRLLSQ